MCPERHYEITSPRSDNDNERPNARTPMTRERLLALGAIVTGAIGCCLALIGAVSSEWVITEKNLTWGLNFACDTDCSAFAAQGSFVATKVFVDISFFCAFGGVIVSALYYIRICPNDFPQRLLPLVSGLLYIIAVILDVIGVAIFAALGQSEIEIALDTSIRLGYSFVITIVGAVCYAVAGILAMIHRSGLSIEEEE